VAGENVANIPNGKLTHEDGHPTHALMNFLQEVAQSSDIWRMAGISYAFTGGRTSLQAIGFAAPAASAVVAPVGGTTTLGSLGYARYDSAAAINSTATTVLSTNPQYELGDSKGRGGFRIEMYCAMITPQATTRVFWGLINNTAATLAADPSAFTNCIGIGSDAADGSLALFYNDGAGVCTKATSNFNFAKTAGAFYKLTLKASPNSTSVWYRVDRIDLTGTSATTPLTGTLTTNIPSNSTLLGLVMLTGNGATAAAVQHGLVKAQGEVLMPI
jgi:hypothetical protein